MGEEHVAQLQRGDDVAAASSGVTVDVSISMWLSCSALESIGGDHESEYIVAVTAIPKLYRYPGVAAGANPRTPFRRLS